MKQFKAESKRLMELMINSIYTHKEIFLRELISNASDALDKLYYKKLTENESFERDDLVITLTVDKDARTLTIADTGIGMTGKEMEENLGIIARSGSLQFKSDAEPKDDVDIIGQFGVGFYSSFMVADQVIVRSKAAGGEEGAEWISKGVEGYTIKACEREASGTEIVLHLKPDSEDEKYSGFLEEFRLKSLIKKYSDFIKYPIRMGGETLNSMVPIWRKNKNELTAEDYERFYQDKHFGFEKPLRYAHISAEGVTSYKSLLYIPARPPYDYYTKEFQKGLELYTNGVLIMEKCADLLPDYFGFVQGLVDSADLSLNISRELLQHDRQLKLIARRIKEKIKAELVSMRDNDRESYEAFFKNFGRALKFGVYSEWGAHKEDLQELLMFYSSKEKKLVTLAEYVARMPESQKVIYYASGDSIERIEKLPQVEFYAESEILFFTEDVDEFAVRVLGSFEEKEFKSVQSGDTEASEEKKDDAVKSDDIFAYMSEILSDKVKEVRASKRLKSHPVCLVAGGELSIEMEKVLGQMPGAGSVQADKILEVNTGHSMFTALERAFSEDKDLIKRYTSILYNQALLIEGLPVDDPVGFANDVCELIR